jgi:Holliday junction resolvase-like predicted endonuclease
MVNELAAHGVIEDEDCDVYEEMVQGTRALSFQKGNVVVSVPKLGDTSSFRGYWPGSKVDERDQKMVSCKLQSVMHDRALQARPSVVNTSPESARCSDDSRLRGTTLTSSEMEEDVPAAPGRDASLENCGLIKFVKVHWKQSKWIVDNIYLIRSPQCSDLIRAPGHYSDDTTEEEEEDCRFKAVIVWSNKTERQDGINLLERMIAARLGGNKNSYMKDVMECGEIMDDGEEWLVFHKKEVVVGFPGRHGDDEFLASVQAMETVWC